MAGANLSAALNVKRKFQTLWCVEIVARSSAANAERRSRRLMSWELGEARG